MSDIYQKYSKFAKEDLIEKVRLAMSEKRFKHVLAVSETAKMLAKKFNGDKERASMAGLVHDYAKERKDSEMITLIKKEKLPLDLIEFGNSIWHSVLGSILIEKELGITDSEIKQAVALHTTGSAKMDLLSKIIFVADYIEPNRNFPEAEIVRQAAQTSLDLAVKAEIKQTMQHLIQREVKIYPKSLETYNYFITQK